MSSVDVAIVGGGPAGCAAAVALRSAGASVVVIEREDALGGIARHADHTGYGLREFRRLMKGPTYARAWSDRVTESGADVRVDTTVTDLDGRSLTLTSSAGRAVIEATAVVLATGTRERPRSARLVPGTRPLGVLTTGALQQLVALHGRTVGRRAVIVGAEHVSFSAILTLPHGGCRPVALVTDQPRPQTYRSLRLATATRHRVPVLTRSLVTRILGTPRVEAVEITDLDSGDAQTVDCDTVVFTGDWVPDHELARRSGIPIDAGTRAPRVDAGLRTAVPGVFAAGNLLHGAETAGVCARSGAWVARAATAWLDDGTWPAERAVPVECDPPLRWISPNMLAPGDDAVPYGHFLLRTAELVHRPRLTVTQGSRELWSGRVRPAVPTMPIHLPSGWARGVRADEPVHVTVTDRSVTERSVTERSVTES